MMSRSEHRFAARAYADSDLDLLDVRILLVEVQLKRHVQLGDRLELERPAARCFGSSAVVCHLARS
jgi:hypothetical protein